MELPSYFTDFLAEIRPTANQLNEYKTGHTTLRNRLDEYDDLKDIIVSTFLQGSYRRSTAIRPKSGKRSDVDIIVVTTLDKEQYTPQEALDIFVPFLEEHYKDKYRIQGRSIGIELSYVDLDLVVTSAPSEVQEQALQSDSVITMENIEDLPDWTLSKSWIAPAKRIGPSYATFVKEAEQPEWKQSPLYIPDCDADEWRPTHPLAQIAWTFDKNKECNGHYVNVVKAIKWLRRVNYTSPDHPKGYPLEHLVGVCCPDAITSVASGVTQALEAVVQDYESYATGDAVPELPDHGVPEHNVFARVTAEEFKEFYDQVVEAAKTARRALDATTIKDSADAWRELFGSKFPAAPETSNNSSQNQGGFTQRTGESVIGDGRFA